MDPFNQVYSDAIGQLKSAEQLLDDYRNSPSTFYIEDLNNVVQELVETIHDLSQSTGVVQANPAQFGLSPGDVAQRITQVGNLNSQLTDIQESIAKIRRERKGKAAMGGSGRQQAGEDDNEMSGAGAGNALMYQEAIASQDNMLDSVYNTVSNLNQQAHIMSQELEDQSNLIEDFERQVDTSQDRLARGMKRVNWVIENNRETLSSCCITLLIVVLIVLLVLLLVL
jgi:t-SNARE syntaxin family protein